MWISSLTDQCLFPDWVIVCTIEKVTLWVGFPYSIWHDLQMVPDLGMKLGADLKTVCKPHHTIVEVKGYPSANSCVGKWLLKSRYVPVAVCLRWDTTPLLIVFTFHWSKESRVYSIPAG